MVREYDIKPLTDQSAPKAYPLIQAACPEVSLNAWIDYATQLSVPSPPPTADSGILIAESGRGYIHGLFAFSVRVVLNQRAVLTVENFIAVDMGDRAAATKALIAVMEQLAKDHNCSAIHTHIPDSWNMPRPHGTGMLDHLRAAGHRIEYVKFCKVLEDG